MVRPAVIAALGVLFALALAHAVEAAIRAEWFVAALSAGWVVVAGMCLAVVIGPRGDRRGPM